MVWSAFDSRSAKIGYVCVCLCVCLSKACIQPEGSLTSILYPVSLDEVACNRFAGRREGWRNMAIGINDVLSGTRITSGKQGQRLGNGRKIYEGQGHAHAHTCVHTCTLGTHTRHIYIQQAHTDHAHIPWTHTECTQTMHTACTHMHNGIHTRIYAYIHTHTHWTCMCTIGYTHVYMLTHTHTPDTHIHSRHTDHAHSMHTHTQWDTHTCICSHNRHTHHAHVPLHTACTHIHKWPTLHCADFL